MSANHVVNSSDYVLSAELVLTAGRRLQSALLTGASPAKMEYIIAGLEQAAEMQNNRGAAYHNFMFSELTEASETEKVTRERIMEDVLASVLTDLQVANVLMAAGQAMGELGAQPQPQKLGESLRRLENTSQVIAQSLASPLRGGAEPGRFGFAEDVVAPEAVKSADLGSAKKTFKKRSDETLTSLVGDAKEVVMSAIKALSEIGAEKVAEAFSKLGDKIGELDKVGRLFRRGVRKLESAINALLRLLGEDLLKKVKEQVEKLWEGLKGGKYVSGPLEFAFSVKATSDRIDEILARDGLKLEALDDASNALARLKQAFKENMEILSAVVTTISLVGTFLLLIPAIGAQVALIAASANAMILGAVVLIGMDYTDSGILLKRVRGVKEIAEGLAQ
jgi:hypothetical protein